MTAPARPAPIPLTLLTGFLGAGKTTLLNRILRDEALAGTLVIVNEFGEVGLDHLMIEGAEDGTVLMASGCLCCTIRDDLIVTLEDLLRRRDNGRIEPFSRIVIETTGLADPAPILNVLINHPYIAMRFRLDGVVTLVDAVNAMATLDAHQEALRQIVAADRLVLTKTDLVADPAALSRLRRRLAALAPGVPLLGADAEASEIVAAGLYDLAARPAALARWLGEAGPATASGHRHAHDHHAHDHGDACGEHEAHVHDVNRHDAGIRAVSLVSSEPVSPAAFDLFWSLLRATHGGKLLRLKGLVALATEPEHPLLVHAVQQVMHPPVALPHWPDDDRRSRLVLIVDGIDEAAISALWAAFLGGGALLDPPSARSGTDPA